MELIARDGRGRLNGKSCKGQEAISLSITRFVKNRVAAGWVVNEKCN